MERYLEARGLSFRTVNWGGGDDPILLLHGLFGPVETFSYLADAFVGERPLLAFDQRGHGGTTYPEHGYDIPTLADDAAAIIRQVGAPLDVVGHSMGAAVALTLAARHRGIVRRMILCEPPMDVSAESEVPRLIAIAPRTFPSVNAGVTFQQAILTDLTPERAMQRLHRMPSGQWTWRFSVDGLKKLLSGTPTGTLCGFEPWLDAPLINCPTVVVRGSESSMFLRHSLDHLVAAIPPAEGIQIAEVGHPIPYQKPNVLAGLMRGFLPARG